MQSKFPLGKGESTKISADMNKKSYKVVRQMSKNEGSTSQRCLKKTAGPDQKIHRKINQSLSACFREDTGG